MTDSEILVAHIRENIRRRIKEAGFPSIEKFAFENGLMKTTISRVIKGSRNPRLVTLVEIANALGIPLSELLELDKIESANSRKKKI